jgi:glycosyltransferase involved in cell wall biosynthesis
MSMFGTTTSVSRLVRIALTGGVNELVKRVARKAYQTSGAEQLDFPLRVQDVADSTKIWWTESAGPVHPGRPLTVSWICAPPGPGSGGHTTMFRFIRRLEAAGHTCVVHLYDPYGVQLADFTAIIRRHWPEIQADVTDIDSGLCDSDVFVATSWQTAHVLASRPQKAGRRVYFVQDYEPYFYPRGSEYALAEDTYRFGFEILALGRMVHDEIVGNTGAHCVLVPFGCDVDTYSLTNDNGRRHGVAFYSRPTTARRGSTLAGLALDLFHERRPNHTIHVIGARPFSMSAPAVVHPHLAPAELADLYNTTIAGIGMSFTNISLVVEEMLMCGTIPVVNDCGMARADMKHPGVAWAAPNPTAIADRLCELVDAGSNGSLSASAAADRRTGSWDRSADMVVDILENAGRISVSRQ